jgi:uncharacterized protein (TIGR03435 family)
MFGKWGKIIQQTNVMEVLVQAIWVSESRMICSRPFIARTHVPPLGRVARGQPPHNAVSAEIFESSFRPRPFLLGAGRCPIAGYAAMANRSGRKMAFDVASVKPVASGSYASAGFPLDAGNGYRFTGGRFSAAFPLIVFIMFAYKLTLTPGEMDALLAPLPKWVGRDSFRIQARAPIDNPSKDQLRLMMQSLLADRFLMSVHFETQTVPALALVVAKPGKLGPQLHPHSEGPACPAEPGTPNFVPESVKGVFPQRCEVYGMEPQANGMSRLGARNTTIELLASMIPVLGGPFGSVTRPVVDRTGLGGRFDFTIDVMPESRGVTPPSNSAEPEPAGPTLLEALKEQLGLKLEPTRAPIQILIIDHIERPSEN